MMKDPWKVLIISCWSLLAVCVVLKLFGVNWFAAGTDNPNFIAFCNFVDNHLWIKYTVVCLLSLLLNSLTLLAMFSRKWFTKLQFAMFIPYIIVMSLIGWYVPAINSIMGVLIFIIPMFFLGKKWWRALIGFGLVTAFQLVSMFLKEVGHIYLNDESTLVGIILQFDSIIMVTLYYLYANKKRKEIN